MRSGVDDDGQLTTHYEQLRSDALNHSSHGFGLALFLRQGMTSWMRAWTEWTKEPSAAASVVPLAAPLPGAIRAQLTLILASVLTRSLQEARP